MTITATIIGEAAVIESLRAVAPATRMAIKDELQALTVAMTRDIMRNKLSGQLLQVQTGQLRRNIGEMSKVLETQDGIYGQIGTSVGHGIAYETGDWSNVKEIKMPKAIAPPVPGPRKRPFLATTLEEFRPEIITSITRAFNAAARDAMR